MSILRKAALVVLVAGALVSVGFTIRAGLHNRSYLLVILFICWVLSPFVGLALIQAVSKPWPALTRATIYWVMLVLPVLSVVCYSGILSRPGTKNAFVFLMVPLASWILLTTVIMMAAARSRAGSRRRTTN